MEKQKIIVPEGIRFLSDWEDFKLSNFPTKCIINKQIPGCGFTEYCINGPEYIILCSPRKMLLKNKFDQHENDVYLVVNEMDKDPGVDKDIDKDLASHRLNMVKIAIAQNPKFELSDIEYKSERKSYSILTVKRIIEQKLNFF